MDIITLLSPERISYNRTLSSKKRAFETLAQLLATSQSQVTHTEVFDALMNREKLGCTALGRGIAIPHARLDISKPRAAILSLQQGIALDAPDKQAVTFLIGILLPKQISLQHMSMLQELTTIPYHSPFVENLHHYQEPSAILNYLSTFHDSERIAA